MAIVGINVIRLSTRALMIAALGTTSTMQACDASLQSYPILSHITRVAISETNGRAWDVCNRC